MAHLTEHKAWCSTLVDDTGHHVGGQGKWGNCGPDCPIPPDTRNSTRAVPGRTDFCYKVRIKKMRHDLKLANNRKYTFFVLSS